MQGIEGFISTEKKAQYINQLLKVGFDTIDFGSFVSPKAIPQMRDTKEVLKKLELSSTSSKLLAIIANTRGAEEAAEYDEIAFLGFPLSISETFQQRNTNKSIAEAIDSLKEIQNICLKRQKTLVTYISMGFGNPYGDHYDTGVVERYTELLDAIGVTIISLADTVGTSNPTSIRQVFEKALASFPHVEFGAHLHSRMEQASDKILTALKAGCVRFDGAIGGLGGCPMADDELVGNIATETLVQCFTQENVHVKLNKDEFGKAVTLASEIFV